jgi:hypothetical protein
MDSYSPSVAGIDDVEVTPKWKATGDRSLRVRDLHKRHIKLLDDLQTELDDVGRREAVAALCEYYYRNPEKVLDEVKGPKFR